MSPGPMYHPTSQPETVCSFCGKPAHIGGPPLTHTTLGLSFVSEPFPVHEGCANDYMFERASDEEMRRDLGVTR